jgi:hypothetical protein
MRNVDGKPPRNTKRVYKWDDLPDQAPPQLYEVTTGATTKRTFISKKRLRVMEGLIKHPLFAASPVRISDHVLHLKTLNGVDIETLVYKNDPETGRERYGVNFLRSTITPVTDNEEAA